MQSKNFVGKAGNYLVYIYLKKINIINFSLYKY